MKHAALNAITSDAVRATAAWALLGVCVFSVLMYSYFVSASIFQAFETKQFSAEASETLSRLNTLESDYLALQNTVTIARARALGFTEVSKQHFISRQSLGQVLSLHDDL